jgi:hypothetical protein
MLQCQKTKLMKSRLNRKVELLLVLIVTVAAVIASSIEIF